MGIKLDEGAQTHNGVCMTGFEPRFSRLQVHCSTTERSLYPLTAVYICIGINAAMP